MTPPRDRPEFIIRFVCAAVFFGIIVALLGFPYIERLGWYFLALWLVVTGLIATAAAMFGDEVWHKLIDFIRWW
ncbi:hypothetical protein OKA04_08430 [Luteolibacter flavescens]|uniref:DUF4175 domain-containing protein n=1 Tax=Luteolibacter flavescens TaxID=1859460 RepID=A0ABT3FMR4_9BACT|nr:hypothetical protein [Luteolibacter flavescens]MCW1884752.1 hypothetical protein [Luteolibacter flavescens]